jgi:hypothetical protein
VYFKNKKNSFDLESSGSVDILSMVKNLTSKSISKTKLIRFNPFDDVGSNQSFILVFLDNSDSGVIITSLHNRGSTRIYAKTIVKGESPDVSLSKEEKSAIIETINSN